MLAMLRETAAGAPRAVLLASAMIWASFQARGAAMLAEVASADVQIRTAGGDLETGVTDPGRQAQEDPCAQHAPYLTRDAVEREVSDAVLAVLGSRSDRDTPLAGAGLDSLGAVELRNTISARLECRLPVTLVYDYPTPAAMAGFLAQELAVKVDPGNAQGTAVGETLAAPRSPLQPLGPSPLVRPRGVAITAFGGETAASPATSARCFMSGVDAMQPVPLDRWDRDHGAAWSAPAVQTRPLVPAGGFVTHWALFDAQAFHITHSGEFVGVGGRGLRGRRTW